MGAVDQQPQGAADQQGGGRASIRRARPSRWWSAIGRAGGQDDRARRPHLLPRLPRHRRHPVPLLEQDTATARSMSAAGSRIAATCSSTRWRGARGIDRVAAMANRFGIGVDLEIELPGARKGLMPTREWRMAQGPPLEHRRHDQLRHRPGLHPDHAAGALHLCLARGDRARGAAASDPHAWAARCSRACSPTDWPALGPAGADLHLLREGMWAVVNEGGGTAPLARLPIPGMQLAGKTGSTPGAPRVARGARARRLQVGEPALGVPAARAVRLLRAV